MFKRFVAMIAPMACPACPEGSGTIFVSDDEFTICPVCKGSGLESTTAERRRVMRHLAIRRSHQR